MSETGVFRLPVRFTEILSLFQALDPNGSFAPGRAYGSATRCGNAGVIPARTTSFGSLLYFE